MCLSRLQHRQWVGCQREDKILLMSQFPINMCAICTASLCTYVPLIYFNGVIPYLQFPSQCYQFLHHHNLWHWCTVFKTHAPLKLHKSSRERQATGLHQHHVGYWGNARCVYNLCWLGSCPMSLKCMQCLYVLLHNYLDMRITVKGVFIYVGFLLAPVWIWHDYLERMIWFMYN